MNESAPTNDEMTGGLSGPRRPDEATEADEPDEPNGPEGPDGSDEPEAPASEHGVEARSAGSSPAFAMPGVMGAATAVETAKRLPARARLAGVVLQDGRAVGTDLPPLDRPEILAPWRAALGRGGLYVRCLDRAVPLPTAQVQRLARVGELWLDGALPPPDEVLDVLVAGVHRFVVWPGEADDLDEVLTELGDAAALGWSDEAAWPEAKRLALLHGIPVMATFDPPEDRADLDVYRLDIPAAGPFEARLLGPSRPAQAASSVPPGDGAPPSPSDVPAGDA